MQRVRWQVVADGAALVAGVAQRIVAGAQAAIDARGRFDIVLAGGHTPLAVYARLAGMPADWPHWHIYFGDERCLPAGDVGRNDTTARHAWLDRVPIPAANLHAIPAELGAEPAARAYAEILKGVSEFDLVLLGLGEDGHTASLFPGQAAGDAAGSPDVLAVHGAPKPPAERVSLSAARLSRARQVLFLVSGAGKRAAVAAWRRGADIPARHIAPPAEVEVWLDAAADVGAD